MLKKFVYAFLVVVLLFIGMSIILAQLYKNELITFILKEANASIDAYQRADQLLTEAKIPFTQVAAQKLLIKYNKKLKKKAKIIMEEARLKAKALIDSVKQKTD